MSHLVGNTVQDKYVLEFAVMSPEEIERQAVIEITQSNLFHRGVPVTGSINDLRLGTCNRDLHCATCKHSQQTCLGHPGFIRLAEPVYHYLMLERTVRVLNCVCFWCSSLLIDRTDPVVVERFRRKKLSAKRLAAISVYARGRACPKCGGSQPKYTAQKPMLIRTWPAGTSFEDASERAYAMRPFRARDARRILQNVHVEDYHFIGLVPERSHPADMILTNFLIPPISTVAPHTSRGEHSKTRGLDDLTTLLRDIVKQNEACKKSTQGLKDAYRTKRRKQIKQAATDSDTTDSNDTEAQESKQVSLEDEIHQLSSEGKFFPQKAYDELVLTMGTYFDIDGGCAQVQTSLGATGVSRTTRRSITRSSKVASLGNRLGKGKKGRVRSNIFGKRVDFSSRSVIIGDAMVDIHELTVPHLVATTQYVEEKVTNFNLEDLRTRIRRGPKRIQGAHHVVRPNGTMIHLAAVRDPSIVADALAVGWTVARYLKNGDVVLFNRQPTLHKQSLMSFRVRLPPETGERLYAFRLPDPCTPAFNADFGT